MFSRIAFSLLCASSLLSAQGIPDRPEKLTFGPLSYQPPRAKDFKTKLANGVPLCIAPDSKGMPLVRLTVSWRGGAFLEPRGKEGLASLFGSQLVQGGTTKLTPAALEDKLEDLSATLRADCGGTSGSLSLQVLDTDFKEGLELLMQVLAEPAFSQDRLDLAKRAMLQGMEKRNDTVNSIAGYQMPRLLFGENHFMSMDVTAVSLAAITREDLAAFHRRLMHPDNLVVSVSGKFDRQTMLETLNKTLGKLKASRDSQLSPKVPAPAFQRQPGIYIADKPSPQSVIQWAMPGMRRTDPDWHAAVVMNQILGGSGFTSRLVKKIRSDEGLTYGVRTSLSEGAYWLGDLSGGLSTKHRSVAYALRLALAEMQRLKDQPVSEEELKVIKDGLIEAFPAQFPSKQAVAGFFASETLVGWPEDWWMDYREKIQVVTATDVQRVAKRLLDLDHIILLVVGQSNAIAAGDPDHPGALKDVAKLPLVSLPLRDPLTLKPLP